MEQSLQDKVCEMNFLGVVLAELDLQSNVNLPDADSHMVWAVCDGLREKFVLDRITGHCSLAELQKWGCEELERFVDNSIAELKVIYFKYFADIYTVQHSDFWQIINREQ